MNKKIFSILVSIFAVCGMIMIASSASATTVNSVDITSPIAASPAYVKAGGTVTVNFNVTTNEAGSGHWIVQIWSGDDYTTAIVDTKWQDANFSGGTDSFSAILTIPAGTPDGLYNVYAGAQGTSSSVSDIEGAVVVDNTPPTSAATIEKDSYGTSTWVPASTINGTVSDGTGSGVATITITIEHNYNGQYWNGTSWEDLIVDLPVTLSGDNWTYYIEQRFISDHNYTVTPTATDKAGNSAIGTSDSFTYDITSPTVNITSTASGSTNISPIRMTATFNEAVENFTIDDITVTNATTSNFTTVSDSVYTFNVTPSSQGEVTVFIPSMAAQDIAGNNNQDSNLFSITYDTTPPAAPTVSDPAEAKTLNADNYTIKGTAEAGATVKIYKEGVLAGSGTADTPSGEYSISVTLTQDAVNNFTVTATDAAGNESEATTVPAITEDSTDPTVTISSTATSPTKTSPIPITVTFSEVVEGFGSEDISVINGTVSDFSESSTTYTFKVTPSSQGAVKVDIDAEVATDAAGNGNTAAAQFSITYYTTDTYTFTVGSTGDFDTIQEAINAASSGDTINVTAGAYKEQLVINKSLTLQGAGAGTTIIEAPDTMTATSWSHRGAAFKTLIEVNGTSAHNITVNISGFTIDGLNKSSSNPRYTGIVYHNADGTISNNTITKFGNNPPTGADGWGIFVVEGSDVTISGNTIDNWGKGGIVVDGDDDYANTDVTASITGNNITGAGEITAVAQNGIQISRGATGAVSNNTVNGNYYDGSAWSGSGILLYYSKNVLVSENTLTGNQTGIYINGQDSTYTTDDSQIKDNNISGGKYGIALLHTKNTTITSNTISRNTASGFRLRADETNTIIRGNNITGNNTSDVATAGGILIENDADVSQITANFNNIVGNKQYGILNNGINGLDASNNWWGDSSGPSGVGSGSGDAVSANVDYDPWTGAEIENSKTGSVTDGTLDAKAEAGTEVDVKGTATVTVTAAKYSGNPGDGFSGDIGKYIDVHIDTTTGVTELEIRLYYTDAEVAGKIESTLRMYWWDGTSWSPCTDSGVDTSLNYIWAKIRSDTTDTTPNLTQLAGTPFGGSGSPVVVTGGGGGGGGGVIDTIPPVISDIKVEAHSDKAIVSWTTDEPSISWVAYGTIPDYGNAFQDSNYVTSHTITLSLLSPQTTYYYQVKARDRAGNVSSGSGATFTTLGPGEVLGASTKALTVDELMAKVNELKAQLQELQNKLAQLTGKVVLGAATYEGIPQDFSFKNNLKEGDSSNDVKYLQIILKDKIGAPTYPENVPATGWFGPITKAAVIKFQEKYASEILTPLNLTQGTGLVASATRAKLNQLLGR